MHSYQFCRFSRSDWVELCVTLSDSTADPTLSRRLGIDFLRSLLTWVILWSYTLAVPLLPPWEKHPIKNRAGRAFPLQDFLFCCPCLLFLTCLLLASSRFYLFWVHLMEWGEAKSCQGFWRDAALKLSDLLLWPSKSSTKEESRLLNLRNSIHPVNGYKQAGRKSAGN